MNRRVVVTGLGVVSPLGVGAKRCWEALLSGKCGVTSLTGLEYEKIPSKVAALVPTGKEAYQFDASSFSNAEWRQMTKSIAYGLVAAAEAMNDSQWTPNGDEERARTGVTIGVGMIDLFDVYSTGKGLEERGYHSVSPYFIPRILPNMAGGQIGIRYGLQGPNHCVSTACATGCHAIGDGMIMIKRGQADVMICGSTEAPIVPLTVAGFSRLRALCTTFNDQPLKASRPFDVRRGGFVIGEGAGVVILEELSHAQRRNAKIYGEVLGYGLSGDGFHLTSPDPEGRGTTLCMSRALQDAGIKPDDVGYVNAHATSTKLGDDAECKSISKVMRGNDHLVLSSTKGATGHLLGAAGSLEAIFTLLACMSGKLPPSLNLEKTDITAPVNFAPAQASSWVKTTLRRVGICNSFGFGGTNATLCVANFVD